MKNCFKGAVFQEEMQFCFEEKENKEEEYLEIVIEPQTTDSGWIIRPVFYPCMV